MNNRVRNVFLGFTVLLVGAVAAPAEAADTYIDLNFDGLAANSQYNPTLTLSEPEGDVVISVPGTNTNKNPIAVFDAECGGAAATCTGNDPDLYAPGQGQVLIIQDETNTTEPDDEDAPVTFFFDFSDLDCDELEIVDFVAIDATATSYSTDITAVPADFVDAGFGNLEDGFLGAYAGPAIALPDAIFQLRLADSGAIDDVEVKCINPDPNDSFLKFDPAAQSILAGQSGFNFHLQMGNPGGFPNAPWNDAELICDTQPLEDEGLVVDVAGINQGAFANVATDVNNSFVNMDLGISDALVLSGLSQPVINGQYFDVNIPADTTHLATGDYQLDCTLFVPGAAPFPATFDLNIRTQANQDGGPVNTNTDAYIQFNSPNPVNSNANQWWDSLYLNVEFGNLTDVTIDGAEIDCLLATNGNAFIADAQAHGGFGTVTNNGSDVSFTGAQTLQNFQSRNVQIVLDGLYQDTDTELTCTISYPQNGGIATDTATLMINN